MKITELVDGMLAWKNTYGDIPVYIGGSFRGIPHADSMESVTLGNIPGAGWVVIVSANVRGERPMEAKDNL